MAEAIISGALENGALKKEEVYATNHSNKNRLQQLEELYGIGTGYELAELLKESEVIILAMKPKDAEAGLKMIRPYVSSSSLVISVLAGIPIHFIERELGTACAVIRAMPNTSAAVSKSATGIALNEHVTDEQKQIALALFSSIGMAKIVDEQQLDAVTGLSGSGPAYIYYVVEAMEKAAEEIGLEKEVSKPLIIQTLLGAAEMLSVSDGKARELRKAITSPGGTTEAGIKVLEDHKIQETFIECIKEATAQSKRLGAPYQKVTN